MKKQMNSIQNNPKKCLRMCEEIRTMLTSLKSKIQSMDYSLKDKALKLSPLISAIGGVILAAAGRASGNDAVNYASIGASVGSMGLGAAIRTYRKDLYSKEAALKIIDTELRCCDECIKDLRG